MALGLALVYGPRRLHFFMSEGLFALSLLADLGSSLRGGNRRG